ncbi:hypothetical protein E0H73_30660 [Kribbella pittospori]|uniref:DUF4129 domain-containing protein n=1 Tax=Kribbella pittospori TaxID=722689 RepID=A0A4R0KBL1_9ACTN|nr:hypothetical protein [Kribbella pittospori]TCC57721.1 hypothetical protein E0H73_30660 [Kribbella pittospori]
MSSVRVMRVVVLAVAALLLGSCGDGGTVGSPTVAPSRSPGERPEVTGTVPSPTRSPARAETAAPSPEETETTRTPARPETTAPSSEDTQPDPTRTVTRTETDAPPPAPTQTETRTETITPTQSEPASPTSPPTSPAIAPTSAEASDTPSWLWWLLIAFLVALAVAIPLLVRSRHRRAWRDDLAAAEQDVAWFARSLIPDLRQTGSVEAAAGGWTIAASRVTAAEDRLTVLQDSAPDDSDRARATTLRDAVRSARLRMEALRDSSTAETLSQDLDAAAADLESALTPPAPPE